MRDVRRVRYYECDMQRVVHNAVYLAWCDDVADAYFRHVGAGLEDDWWDVMVKSASLTWTAPARHGDDVAIDVSVSRWGNTSFDVTFAGERTADERAGDGPAPLFEATITYVAVRTGTTETVPVPESFRHAADHAVDAGNAGDAGDES